MRELLALIKTGILCFRAIEGSFIKQVEDDPRLSGYKLQETTKVNGTTQRKVEA